MGTDVNINSEKKVGYKTCVVELKNAWENVKVVKK